MKDTINSYAKTGIELLKFYTVIAPIFIFICVNVIPENLLGDLFYYTFVPMGAGLVGLIFTSMVYYLTTTKNDELNKKETI